MGEPAVTVSDVLMLAKIAHLEARAYDVDIDKTAAWQDLAVAAAKLTAGTAEAIASAKQAEAAYERQEGRIQGLLSEIERAGVTDAFNPHGWFVYTLWERDRPLYVGESGNVLSRLGSHLVDKVKRDRVSAVSLMRCKTERAMHETEARLIRLHRPPLNVVGNRDV